MLSSRSPVLSVGLAAVIATLYGLAMASLFVLRIGVTVMLPTWTMWVVPVALYAFLTLVSVTGVPILKRLAVFGALCGAYAAVAALTGCLVAAVVGLDWMSAVQQASSRFMPAPLLQLFAVPMLLLPFRGLLAERPRPSHARPKSQPARTPSPAAQEAVPGWESAPRLDALRPDPASAGLAFAAARPAAPPVTPSVAVEPAPVVDGAPHAPLAFSIPGVSRASAGHAPRDPMAVAPATASIAPSPVDSTPEAAVPVVASPVASAPVASDEPVRPRATTVTAAIEAPEELPVDTRQRVIEAPAAVAESDESAAGTMAAPDAEDTVAIPFDRVESQLPADLFSGPVAAIGARLVEPGHLLVPVRVVLPQLVEGIVTVKWGEVADQFPADVFAGMAYSVAERLADGRLVLPLDELVRRLPADVFALSVAAPDVSALESFPLPFQPVSAEPVAEPVAPRTEAVAEQTVATAEPVAAAEPVVVAAERSVALAMTEPPAHVEEAAETAEPPMPPVVAELGPALAALRLATGRAPEPTQRPVGEPPSFVPPFVVETPPSVSVAPPPAPVPPFVVETFAPAPVAEPPAPEPSFVVETFSPAPVVESPAAEPSFVVDTFAPAPVAEQSSPRLDRLAGTLSPLGALASSVTELGGATVYVFRQPSLPADAVMEIAATALPLLGAGPTPVEQLTLRLDHGALVLTPLASAELGPTLLVASSPRNGSLALLEILSLRARPSDLGRSGAPRLESTIPVEELDPVAGGPAADLLAGALRGFGTFRPSVLRDPAGRVELCMLLAPGDDARALGSFAHAACCALSPAAFGGALGAVQSAVFRLGPRRLALRPFEGRPGHWIALCTPGDGARPGLVHLEMERAAAHAAAR